MTTNGLNTGGGRHDMSHEDSSTRTRLLGPQRRRQIVEVTVDLVRKYGVQGATTARIAAETGVSEKALYNYFPTRRDMLVAAADLVMQAAMIIFETGPETDAVTRLRSIMEKQLQRASTTTGQYVYPLFEFLGAAPELGLRDHIAQAHRRHLDIVVAIVRAGIADGSLRKDVDADQVAWEVFATLFGTDGSYLVGNDVKKTASYCEVMFERLLRDITPEPQSDPCSSQTSLPDLSM
jgi:AcrR family transcriptional regulator